MREAPPSVAMLLAGRGDHHTCPVIEDSHDRVPPGAAAGGCWLACLSCAASRWAPGRRACRLASRVLSVPCPPVPVHGGRGLVKGDGAGGGAGCAEFWRAAAAAARRGRTDPGGAGGGGGPVPAVGQCPGAGSEPDGPQGHGPAAGRCAGPFRAAAGAVRGGGARAGPGGRGADRRGRRGSRGGDPDAAPRYRQLHRPDGRAGPAGRRGDGRGRSGRGGRRRGGDPRDRRDGRGRQDHVRGARGAPAGRPFPGRAVFPAAARAHAGAAAGGPGRRAGQLAADRRGRGATDPARPGRAGRGVAGLPGREEGAAAAG